ncbi:hypothetical protein OFL47_16960 [Pseudomonas aeruginosa]|uniref:hypothetical protein n=1 Tax=Pseudomonas aeruginosa TaxID=287 RepID=UPI0021F1923E|nr:hypothetical protein [Pseudomonas aeruginosa]MCV6338284.1 hypothetical protein [Pseudomonas aeruginosa]
MADVAGGGGRAHGQWAGRGGGPGAAPPPPPPGAPPPPPPAPPGPPPPPGRPPGAPPPRGGAAPPTPSLHRGLGHRVRNHRQTPPGNAPSVWSAPVRHPAQPD